MSKALVEFLPALVVTVRIQLGSEKNQTEE
jgi:hypothetical protein